MSQPKAKRVAADAHAIHLEIDLGPHVAAPVTAEIGPVEVRRYPRSEEIAFGPGTLRIWRGETTPATLVLGTGDGSLSIDLTAMQARQIWRGLTGRSIPGPSPVCPEHNELTTEQAPGYFRCAACEATAEMADEEVVA